MGGSRDEEGYLNFHCDEMHTLVLPKQRIPGAHGAYKSQLELF